jgi:hypothetical protein
MSYISSDMSGWGCRHQLDDRCLLLRKECKPGMPGCVLYQKVCFISDLERGSVEKLPRKSEKSTRRMKRVGARPRRAS